MLKNRKIVLILSLILFFSLISSSAASDVTSFQIKDDTAIQEDIINENENNFEIELDKNKPITQIKTSFNIDNNNLSDENTINENKKF